MDRIAHQGKGTDFFRHAYFTTNPQVSADLIQRVRYGKQVGEPGRQIVKAGPTTWKLPSE
jgi:hypothetical protein